MRIRILGAGWYGCHLAAALIADRHEVEIHEIADHIFAGASGANPARSHTGSHYPRSGATRTACQSHAPAFMEAYGHLTSAIPVNIYAIAKDESLVDFATYRKVLRDEIEFITVHDPAEFGIENVEGAIMTGERHTIIRKARAHFERTLADHIVLNSPPGEVDDPRWDLNIDATFCANDAANIDRFEPCVMVLLRGPVDRAITIMDGPLPSLYVWDPEQGLCSLTSAKLTPISKITRTWREAKDILDAQTPHALAQRAEAMIFDMARYYPPIRWKYEVADYRLSIRAMPRSGADSRLVDVVRVGERALRVRAGKIDAVFHAERIVKDFIRDARREMKHSRIAA